MASSPAGLPYTSAIAGGIWQPTSPASGSLHAGKAAGQSVLPDISASQGPRDGPMRHLHRGTAYIMADSYQVCKQVACGSCA